MPMPVAHIVFALGVLPLLPDKEVAPFLRGTSMPDIRYAVDYLPREKTHIPSVCWQDVVKEPSSFKAGLLFHALVDQVNNSFIHDSYQALAINETQCKWYLLKLYQDVILYDFIDNWETIATLFDALDDEVDDCQIIRADAMNWQKKIKLYILQKPTLELIIDLLQLNNNGLAERVAAIDSTMIPFLLQQEEIKKPILIFYNQFIQNITSI
jgi:hypothetical protein